MPLIGMLKKSRKTFCWLRSSAYIWGQTLLLITEQNVVWLCIFVLYFEKRFHHYLQTLMVIVSILLQSYIGSAYYVLQYCLGLRLLPTARARSTSLS